MLKDIPYFLPDFTTSLAIIANGQFPVDPQIIHSIKSSSVIITCDGAINNLFQHSIISDFIIGDGDSLTKFAPGLTRNPYIHIPDQNSNDLSKAFNFAVDNFPELPIIIYAANGLREDHSIANFALLSVFAKQHSLVTMISDYGIFNVCHEGISKLTTLKGQQISIFSLDNQAKITCQELKWPLNQFQCSNLFSGTLNQATKESIIINTDKEIIVYRTFEVKEN